MPNPILTKLVKKVAIEIGKYGYRKITEESVVSKAIAATIDNFPDLEVRTALYKWSESEEFAFILECLQTGFREVTNSDVVASFIGSTSFYNEEKTESDAYHILVTFAEKLVAELYKAEGGIIVLANRQEALHNRTISVIEQQTEKFKKYISDEIPKLAETSLSLQSLSAVTVKERSNQNRQILQIAEILRHPQNLKDLERASRMIESLMPELTKDIEEDLTGATPRALAIENAIEQLVKKDKRFTYLLRLRAKLRESQGQWDEAVADLQKYIDSLDSVVSPSVFIEAGILLMTLGNWTQTLELLRKGQKSTLDEADRIRARGIELWIHDYQGRHDLVVEQSQKLLCISNDLDPSLAASVKHRMGRARFTAAQKSNSRELMEISLREIKNAQDLALRSEGFANPFHALWIYRVSNALRTRDRYIRWEEAKQSAEEYGGPVVAHIRLSEADHAIKENQWFLGKDRLDEALQIWRVHPYPKGIFDVSYRLGLVCKELGSDHRIETVMYLRLAERLGTRLKLPALIAARRHLNEVAQKMAHSRQYLIKQADELLAERSFSRILRGWHLSIRASNN